jgi:hypothetical protein
VEGRPATSDAPAMRCRSARVSAASAARSRCAFPAPSSEQALQAVEREGAAEAERQRKIREEEEQKQKAAEAERQRKIREEEEQMQKAAEAERQRKIQEEEERKAAAKVLFPATALPRPNVIRFAGCCRLSHQRQTRHHRSSEKRRLVSCSGPLDRRPFLRWPPRWRVSAVYIARRADDVMTLVFHEPKLCLLIYLFFRQSTPLAWSASKGHTFVCRLLLENAADVNARDTE